MGNYSSPFGDIDLLFDINEQKPNLDDWCADDSSEVGDIIALDQKSDEEADQNTAVDEDDSVLVFENIRLWSLLLATKIERKKNLRIILD